MVEEANSKDLTIETKKLISEELNTPTIKDSLAGEEMLLSGGHDDDNFKRQETAFDNLLGDKLLDDKDLDNLIGDSPLL